MFSSLPSASKVYAAGASKTKQRGATPSSNARKKRRKSKVIPNDHLPRVPIDVAARTTTPTLIQESKKSSAIKSDYESDANESVTSNVVRFYIQEDDDDENLNKSAHDYDNYDDSEFSKASETPKRNMVVTSAEVHCDKSPEVSRAVIDSSCSSISSDEDSVLKNPFKDPPVIVISSSDTPRNSIDENATGVETPNNETEAEETQSSTQIHEDRKNGNVSEEPLLNQEAVIENDAKEFDTHQDGTVKSDSVPVEMEDGSRCCGDRNDSSVATAPEQNIVELESDAQVNNQSNNCDVENDDDDASVHSDCCYSKNIYNEYSTESLDDTDDIFMVDDSKQSNSNGGSTSSHSELNENDNTRSSEVSATESSLGDIKVDKDVMVTKIHQAVDVPDFKITADVACQKSFDLNGNEDGSFIDKRYINACYGEKKSILKRTLSLPCYFGQISYSNSTECFSFRGFKSSKIFASEASFDKKIKRNKKHVARSESSKKSNCKGCSELCLKSCSSSPSDLSQSSCFSSVLPPVTIREARLRSYVVGSVRAAGSLLGVEELSRYFPDKKAKIFVGTWNMNEHAPPKSIDDFLLPLGLPYVPDIYAVGTQEGIPSKSEWEVLMQTTLGPSHVLLMSTCLGLLHLAVFIRRDLIWFCSEPEEAHVPTRPGSMVKTKGAVAISFMFFGTSFLFINSHLTAHERKLKERLADYEKICSAISLPTNFPLKQHYQSKDATSRFDNVFWCGDLNFRLDQDRPSVLNFVESKMMKTIDTCEFLMKHDQLHKAMDKGIAFHGFEEGNITFPPSYKFRIGTSCFSSNKMRVPSYTDRVLYRCKKKGSTTCTLYSTVPDIVTSDHKPVYAVFNVDIRAGRDNIPLAAGMFRREVYLEANRRRATALEVNPCQKNSTVCSIM